MSCCGPPFYGPGSCAPGPCFPAPFYPNGALLCGPSCAPQPCGPRIEDAYGQLLLKGTQILPTTGTFVSFNTQGPACHVNYISSTGIQVPCPGTYNVEYDLYYVTTTPTAPQDIVFFGVSVNGAVPSYLSAGAAGSIISLHGQQLLTLGANSVIGLMNMSTEPNVSIGQTDNPSVTNSLAAQLTVNKLA